MMISNLVGEAHAAENLRSRLIRYAVNVPPVFRATGAWITFISVDIRLVKLRLPLKLKTKILWALCVAAICTVRCIAFTPSCG